MDGMVDFARMKQGGQLAQFFAMYMLSPDIVKHAPNVELVSDEEYIRQLSTTFKINLEKYADIIGFAGNASEMLDNEGKGKMSAF